MQASVDFEQVTAGLTTKSDKIRALSRAGVATADIARFLGIRYQHARNVLMDAGLYNATGAGATAGDLAEPAAAFRRDGPVSAWVKLEADGSLKVPTAMLEAAGLEAGTSVYLRQTSDGLEVISQQAALARVRAIARQFIPEGSPSMVEELIADRRREVERERG